MLQKSFDVVFPGTEQNKVRLFTSHLLKTFLQFIGVKQWHTSEIASALWSQLCKKEYEQRPRITVDKLKELICELLKKYGYYEPENSPRLVDITFRLKTQRHAVCILLGGTSGCGKSTLASLLASRLGFTTLMSTDNVRSVMRSFSDEKSCPILYASSYSAYSKLSLDKEGSHGARVIDGFEAQNNFLKDRLVDLLRCFRERNECAIIEGVHLSISSMLKLVKELSVSDDNQSFLVIPFLVFISNSGKHAERFAIRAKYMTLEPRQNKYIDQFNNIRIIQEYLCSEADKAIIPKIDNTNVDKSIALIQETVLNYLLRMDCTNTEDSDLSLLHSSFAAAIDRYGWKSKEMAKRLRSKLNGGEQHETESSGRQRSLTLPMTAHSVKFNNLNASAVKEMEEILMSLSENLEGLGSLDS